MTQVFLDDGRVERVTVLEAGPCPVTGIRTGPRRVRGRAARLRRVEGEAPVQARARPPQEGRRPAHAPPRGVPRRGGELQVGDTVTVEAFEVGQTVKIAGTSQGQGLPGHDQAPRLQARPEVPRLAQRARPGIDRRVRRPARVMKGIRGPGQMGTSASPRRAWRSCASTRATTCCCPRLGARPQERLRGGPHRCLAPRTWPMADVALDETAFGAPFNGPLVHESVRAELAARSARARRPQDPRRGPRRRRQAVAPEGHRPRPRRLLALADLDGRRQRLRPRPRHYTFKVNRKERRAAFRSALSINAERGTIARLRRRARSTTSRRRPRPSSSQSWRPAKGSCSSSRRREERAALSFRNLDAGPGGGARDERRRRRSHRRGQRPGSAKPPWTRSPRAPSRRRRLRR